MIFDLAKCFFVFIGTPWVENGNANVAVDLSISIDNSDLLATRYPCIDRHLFAQRDPLHFFWP